MSFAETFKALSDPVRREILQLLKNGKMSAGEIGSHFDMTGATISYHLSVLKKADLVWETKVKNYVFYELNTTVVEEVLCQDVTLIAEYAFLTALICSSAYSKSREKMRICTSFGVILKLIILQLNIHCLIRPK